MTINTRLLGWQYKIDAIFTKWNTMSIFINMKSAEVIKTTIRLCSIEGRARLFKPRGRKQIV